MHDANIQTPHGPQMEYFSCLDMGEFKIQRCNACTRAVFYPRNVCPHCGSPELGWITPCGRGTVYSTTVVRRKTAEGGDYNIVLVDLDEGVRMMARMLDRSVTAVGIGARVRAKVLNEDNHGIVVFTEDLEADNESA